MGDFDLGYRPPRIRLLDQQLTLDPDIVRMMGEIEAQMAARTSAFDLGVAARGWTEYRPAR